MENNIFKYITKEISHDSFICWILNWLNVSEDDTNKNIRKLAKDFLAEIVKETKNEDFKKILKKDYKLKIFKQFKKKVDEKESVAIDVLVVIENKYMIIIEDKINTGLHDNQIERYKNGIMKLYKNKKLTEYGVTNLEEKNIITCYYKMFEELNKDTREIKKIVDKVFTRSNMITLLKNVQNIENYQYLYEYYQYISEMEKCLENKENKKIKISEDGIILTKKEIRQILYCDFINSCGDDDICGKSSTGFNTTYWRNIPLSLQSPLGKGFFLKINLYYDDDNRPNTLKIRVNTVYNIANRKALIEEIEDKLPFLESQKLKNRGSDAKGEYTLLNYNIDDFTFYELNNIINEIKRIFNS